MSQLIGFQLLVPIMIALPTFAQSSSQEAIVVIRKQADFYKAKWLKEHPEEMEQIGPSTIASVRKENGKWRITYENVRYKGKPEGESHHFLYIYLNKDLSLYKIVRGPDLIS